MKHVLDGFKDECLFLEPFPHIIIEDALPEKDINMLLSEIEKADSLIDYDSSRLQPRYQLSESDMKENNLDASAEFCRIHSSNEFIHSVFDIFEPFIKTNLPNLPEEIKDVASATTSFIKNVPPISKSYSPRKPHVDNFKDIFAFLFYIKPKSSCVAGGNLQIYKFKDKFHGFDRSQTTDYHYLPSKDLELCKEVQYKNNTLVLFLDGINTIHGVEPLEPGSTPRYYFTGGAQFNHPCYDPRSFLSFPDLLKDIVGEFAQKVRGKYIGRDPYL